MQMSKQKVNFINPTKIYFGKFDAKVVSNKISNRKYGFITTKSFKDSSVVQDVLTSANYPPSFLICDVPANPSVQYIDQVSKTLKGIPVEVIVALGGGSCIDSAKAIARILLQGSGYSIENILKAQKNGISFESVPVIAIPTTTGTGSEVTPFSTIWDYDKKKKFSILGTDVFPEWALVFPELSLKAPQHVMVASALDALSHSFESVWNNNANSQTNLDSIIALKYLVPTLSNMSFENPSISDISNLAKGSLHAGLAISQTKTSIAHSISYPLTATYGLSHGLACSFTLASIIDYALIQNFKSLKDILVYEDINLLSSYSDFFSKLFDRSGASNLFREKIPEARMIKELLPEMIYTERVSNFALPFNGELLENIISKSLKIIYP
jgi:alcohol dehydrogenase